MNKVKSLYYKLTDIFVCTVCICIFVCFFNATQQPWTSRILSPSVSPTFFCILWPQTQRVRYIHMGVSDARTAAGGSGGGWVCGYVSLFFFCQHNQTWFNCTVLVTSSNMLSINVTVTSTLNVSMNDAHAFPSTVCVWVVFLRTYSPDGPVFLPVNG